MIPLHRTPLGRLKIGRDEPMVNLRDLISEQNRQTSEYGAYTGP